jgi:hypothetical protein
VAPAVTSRAASASWQSRFESPSTPWPTFTSRFFPDVGSVTRSLTSPPELGYPPTSPTRADDWRIF